MPTDPSNIIVLHPGYATGDIWAVSTYMVLNPNVCVAITSQRQGSSRGKVDQSATLETILKAALPEGQHDRVRRFDFDNLSGSVNQRTTGEDLQALVDIVRTFTGQDIAAGDLKTELNRIKNKYRKIQPLSAQAQQLEWLTISPTFVTQRCADEWRRGSADEHRRTLRSAWHVDDSHDGLIEGWLRRRGIEPRGRRVVVLWMRWTGKGGETKIEHDTSFEGIRELVEIALQRDDTIVIITGDDPERANYSGGKPKRPKITELTKAGNVFDLTSFWDDPWTTLASRFEQFRLWHYLNRNYKKVRHLGFRSGNLEALALIGCEVRYFEETGSAGRRPPGSERMDPFNIDEIGYKRLSISRVPTRSGQWAAANNADLPPWVLDPRTPKPKDEIARFDKGFAPEDKEEIARYLNPDEVRTAPASPRISSQPSPAPGMVIDTDRDATGVVEPTVARSLWRSICCFPC